MAFLLPRLPSSRDSLRAPFETGPTFSMTEGPARKYDDLGGQAQTEVIKTAGGSRKTALASRGGTSHSSANTMNVVVLTESRAREIGIAVCNLKALHTIELVQFIDNHSYSQTLALLQVSKAQAGGAE